MGQRALVRVANEGIQLYTHWGSSNALVDAVRYAITGDPSIFAQYDLEDFGAEHGDLDYPAIAIEGDNVAFTACRLRITLPASTLAEQLLPTCQWFAICDNPAARTLLHPVLDRVPICERCYGLVTSQEAYP